MKKILLLALLVCTFTVGCVEKVIPREQSDQKAKSLHEVYFKLVQKTEDKEEVNVEEVMELLEGYTYTKDSFL